MGRHSGIRSNNSPARLRRRIRATNQPVFPTRELVTSRRLRAPLTCHSGPVHRVMGALMQANADRIQPYDREHANLIVDMQGIWETLHRSGFSFGITTGEDGLIDVYLCGRTTDELWIPEGDELPGTVAEIVLWLRDKARERYPNSRFARKYRNQVERFGCCHTPGTEWAQSCGCTCPTEQQQPARGAYLVDPKCPAHGFT